MTNIVERLDPGALKDGLDAVDVLLRFRAFTPGPMLVMLAGRFRDDLREDHDMNRLEPVYRGREHSPLDELISIELDSLSGAVDILLQDRFTGQMDDPALPAMLRGFLAQLELEKAERAQIRAEMTRSAKAS
jgi:hypothetical protein